MKLQKISLLPAITLVRPQKEAPLLSPTETIIGCILFLLLIMKTKEFVQEIYREADFITTMMLSKEPMESLRDKKEFQSSLRIKEACSAFLNDEDVEPHVDKFLRKEVELKTYEEMEIWGKFTPPEQFIQYDDVDDK